MKMIISAQNILKTYSSTLKLLSKQQRRFQSSNSVTFDDLRSSTQLLRRSILYVPGNDQRKIDKALKSYEKIDSIVLDCEDGVAIKSKDDARNTITKILNENCKNNRSLWSKLSVRVNSIDSGLAPKDLSIILSNKETIPRTILLPKVDRKSDVDEFFNLLKANNIDERKDKHPIDLIIYVESAIGLLDSREIAKHTLEMCEKMSNMNFAGIVFGSDDFCANIGAQRSSDGHEVLMARQYLILVCKSLNLQAIDSVYINFRDHEGLKRQSIEGAQIGFTGKQCIHPDQIEIVQDSFRPSDEKIDWAKGLIDEFEQAQKSGKGAFVYQGQMIDMPLLKQAFNIMNIAKQINKNKE